MKDLRDQLYEKDRVIDRMKTKVEQDYSALVSAKYLSGSLLVLQRELQYSHFYVVFVVAFPCRLYLQI